MSVKCGLVTLKMALKGNVNVSLRIPKDIIILCKNIAPVLLSKYSVRGETPPSNSLLLC
jgi:hypothetical protein